MVNIEDEFDDKPLTDEELSKLGPMAKPLSGLADDLADEEVVTKTKKPFQRQIKVKQKKNINKVATSEGDNLQAGPGNLNEGEELSKVKIREENGREMRRKRSVDLGLSELILPPMTRNVRAVYKYTGGINEGVEDPSTKLPPELKNALIPGSYMLHDKFETDLVRKNKIMRNLGRPQIEMKNGIESIVETIADIEFIAGFVSVDCLREYRKYVFMELHPLNGSNRHRDRSNEVKFIRVDIKNNMSDMFKIAENELRWDAENKIRKMISRDEIIATATSLGVYTEGENPSILRDACVAAARANPRKFFSISRDLMPSIKLNIQLGLDLGLLEYNQEKRSFNWVETSERIFTHTLSEEPQPALAEFLKKEGQQHYKRLVDILDYWE
jgi:hypothetical protein